MMLAGDRESMTRRRRPRVDFVGIVRRFMTNRLLEAVGITLVLSAFAGVLALVTYAPTDPSFNTTANGPIANMLGLPGAIFADLVWQNVGLGGIGLIAPLFVWGWLAFTKSELPFVWMRVGAWAIGTVLISFAAAALPFTAPAPMTGNLGGLAGLGFITTVTSLAAMAGLTLSGFWAGLIGVLTALIGIALLSFAMGLRRTDISDLGARLVDAGWATYEWLLDRRDQWAEHREAKRGLPQHDGPRVTPAAFVVDDEDEPDSEPRRPRRTTVTRSRRKPVESKRVRDEAQPMLDLVGDDYKLPSLNLLSKAPPAIGIEITDEQLQQNARLLESVLNDYGIKGDITNVRPGPVVTLYELEPAAGIKASRVIGLADDIARSMSAISARVAVVPGKSVIGIELPNSNREMVSLRELLSTSAYESTASRLALALGKGIGGEPVVADLTTMPHLLIAGTTGSGKSVAINTMILSLLYRLPPDRCKLILIDPKMLELSVYDGIPHLLTPVVTDPKKAVVALKWVVRDMEDRYRRMSKLGVRNVQGYNERIAEAIEKGEELRRTVQTGFDKDTGEPIYETESIALEPMPFMVVVIDEMADLMMVAGKDIEGAVQRLAQMARAAGIHLITATQRPSVDVITGTIKANFPTRVSFQVTSKIDSRTVLGEQGAEQLLGQGDMLYMAGGGRIRRVHGPFVSDEEVEKVVKALKKQGRPNYLEDVTRDPEPGDDPLGVFGGDNSSGDQLYDQAVAIVARDRKASTSYIQRKLQIGYNRAARIVEQMEEEGVISQANHSGKREVLVSDHSDY